MKRKIIGIALVCVVSVLISVSSVNAYMRMQTKVVENVFVPAVVTCEVIESYANNQKSSIAIKNTGNVDAFLRLRFVTYWIDRNGDIIFDASKSLDVDYDTTNWIMKDNIYYYKNPVAPGATTSNLLNSGFKITLTTNDGNRQVVEVFAEAIQSLPAEAVQSSWGVNVVGGIITN